MSGQKTEHTGNSPPRLYIKMTGSKVGEAKLAASDLAEIIGRTQQALKRIGQVLYGQGSLGKGRKKKDIEERCQLFVVAWEKGSAIAALELAYPPAQLDLFGYIGEESLKAFLAGMETIATDARQPSALPTGFDVGVLQTCDALGKVLEHGIDEIAFRSENGKAPRNIVYDTKLRDSVRNLLGQPADLGRSSKVGRLEELNGHGSLTGRLWEADGTRWTCHFKQEHVELLPDAWMCSVQLTGRAIVEEGRERFLEVDSIIILDEEVGSDDGQSDAMPFWKSIPLEELAVQQGVSAVDDLDEIASLWPADDDPDELLRHILTERGERRKLSESRGNAE